MSVVCSDFVSYIFFVGVTEFLIDNPTGLKFVKEVFGWYRPDFGKRLFGEINPDNYTVIIERPAHLSLPPPPSASATADSAAASAKK